MKNNKTCVLRSTFHPQKKGILFVNRSLPLPTKAPVLRSRSRRAGTLWRPPRGRASSTLDLTFIDGLAPHVEKASQPVAEARGKMGADVFADDILGLG